jgi:2',3'-cyclic-nucleotide 2'-phosphodiesterase (5'-nucleotidase family)
MISSRISSVVSLGFFVLFAGIAAAQAPPVAAPAAPAVPKPLDVPNNALVAPGPAPEVDLLYTGDVIGYLEDCGCHMNPAGGLARRSWLLSQLQGNYPTTPVVLLDSGNFSDNPTEAGDLRTATLLQTMKKLGYKAINVGERDLNYGYDDFVKRTEGLGLTFISTNIVKQGTKDPIFPPYTVIEAKGTSGKKVRIGVMGVDRYSPIWQKAGPSGTNLGMAAPADMVATYLPEVRAKSDVVVLLAAIAKDDAHELAKQFPKLDLILGTYAGVFSTVDENEGPVHIYYTGNQGKRVGETRIALDEKRAITGVTSYLHFLTVRYPEDKVMQDALAPIIAKTKPVKPEATKTPDAAQKPVVVGVPAAGGS